MKPKTISTTPTTAPSFPADLNQAFGVRHFANAPLELPKQVRKLDPEQTINSLSSWLAHVIEKEGADRLVIGLAGTDSALTFVICSKALELAGKQDALLGVRFGKRYKHLDWLSQYGQVELRDNRIRNPVRDYNSDYLRWAALQSEALASLYTNFDSEPKVSWVVGTRNRTEIELGTYSLASGLCSVQPIGDLWKSEVLDLCKFLEVPEDLIRSSQLPDCACGRDEYAAQHIYERDRILMHQAGELDQSALAGIEQKLFDWVEERKADNGFKKRLPYSPGLKL